MSLLEVVVLLVGGSVIAVLLYGAYQFWSEEGQNAAQLRGTKQEPARKHETGTVPG